MSAEVLVGVIGLAGAVVGAAAAFAGVVYQQGRQAEMARAARRDALAEQAVDTIMGELEKVREVIQYPPTASGAVRENYRSHLQVIQLATLRIPDPELREAIVAACVLELGRVGGFSAHVGLPTMPDIVASAVLWDIQKCLGAYLRQEERPETTLLFRLRDFHAAVIDEATQR